MSIALRAVAVALALGVIWTAAAGRAAAQARLPAAAVVRGAVLVQPFGCTTLEVEPFDPYCPTHHFHSGIDLAAKAGTPVFAAAPGLARVGYDMRACGLFIDISVDAHVRVLYCHLASIDIRDPRVTPGTLIGRIGVTGLTTGPHLHLEVDVDGRAIDPVGWLAGP